MGKSLAAIRETTWKVSCTASHNHDANIYSALAVNISCFHVKYTLFNNQFFYFFCVSSKRLAKRNGITWSATFRPPELNLNPSLLLRTKMPEEIKSAQESEHFTRSHKLHLDPNADSSHNSCGSPSEVLRTKGNMCYLLLQPNCIEEPRLLVWLSNSLIPYLS